MKAIRKLGLIFALALGLALPDGAQASGIDDGTNLSGLGRVSDAWSRAIYPGVTYSRIDSTNSGGRQVTNLVDFNVNEVLASGLDPVIAYGDYHQGTDTLGQMVKDMEDKGYKVVYAINGDSFYWTGEMKGTVIKDGIIESTGDSYLTSLGFTYGDRLMYGNPGIYVKANLNGKTISISQINTERGSNERAAFILTDHFGTTTASSKRGAEVVIDIDTPDYQGLKVETTVNGTVNRVYLVDNNAGLNKTPIKPGQVVISCHEKSQFYKDLAAAKPGDKVSISVKSRAGQAWTNVENAIGVFRPLREKGVKTARVGEAGRHPRTTVALRNDGFMRIMQNDGRQARAQGLSYQECVDFLSIASFDNVFAFDGGGSSTFYATMPGREMAEIFNVPSDGSQRGIGNALLFVKKKEEGDSVDRLHLYPNGKVKSELTMEAGTSVKMDTRATDADFDPVKFDLGQLVYESDLGFGRGDYFVAGPKAGKGTITGRLDNGAEGSIRVRVINQIQSINPTEASISLDLGSSKALSIQAKTPSKTYAIDKRALSYSLDNEDLGYISEDGVFVADGQPGQGTITVSFGDHSAKVPVQVKAPEGWQAESQVRLDRLAGDNRFATASEIAEAFGQADTVILADATNFPDALLASSLAAKYRAPILLAMGTSLAEETSLALKDLGAQEVIILGGASSVDPAIEEALKGQGYGVERIAGANRYETGVLIAGRLESSDHVYLASGENYPDALSIGSLATRDQAPILLTPKDSLAREAKDYISSQGVQRVTIAGGTAAVSQAVAEELEALGLEVTRLGGADRFETSAMVASQAYPKDQGYIFANGQSYIDALTAGPLSGLTSRSILLISGDGLPGPAKDLITGVPSDRLTIIGGENTVGRQVEKDILDLAK